MLSPSAEVQGHSPDERKTVPGKRNVAILEVHPVGNYAVRLVFDDRHSTGIYSWEYLLSLGRNRDRNWKDYLDEMAAKPSAESAPLRYSLNNIQIADGSVSQSQVGAFLGALTIKGPTIEEMTGFASSLYDRAVKLPLPEVANREKAHGVHGFKDYGAAGGAKLVVQVAGLDGLLDAVKRHLLGAGIRGYRMGFHMFRATSATRASPSSRVTDVCVRPPRTALSIRSCTSPRAAMA